MIAIAGLQLGENQIHPLLGLPDMGELVNEDALGPQGRKGEILERRGGWPDDEPTSRHKGAVPNRQGEDPNPAELQTIAKHPSRQIDLA